MKEPGGTPDLLERPCTFSVWSLAPGGKTTCQSGLWSVTAVPLKQAVIPSGHAGGWLSSAASLASSIHPAITDIHTGSMMKRSQWEWGWGCLSILTAPLRSPSSLLISLAHSLFCKIVPMGQTALSLPDSHSCPSSSSSPSKWNQADSFCEEQEGRETSEQWSLFFSNITLLYASCAREEVGGWKVICRCAKQLQQ